MPKYMRFCIKIKIKHRRSHVVLLVEMDADGLHCHNVPRSSRAGPARARFVGTFLGPRLMQPRAFRRADRGHFLHQDVVCLIARSDAAPCAQTSMQQRRRSWPARCSRCLGSASQCALYRRVLYCDVVETYFRQSLLSSHKSTYYKEMRS